MTYHFKSIVKDHFKSAANLAAFLGVHRNTANSYIHNPSQLNVTQVSQLSDELGIEIKELTRIILHNEQN